MKDSDIFTCKMCGDCCRGFGGTYVTEADVAAISAHIRSDPREFVADYCQMSGKRPVLRQGNNGYCVFWDRKCTIHPVKPRMCREWPFIASVLVDVLNWKIMAASCPGIDKDAPEDLVRRRVEEERNAGNRRSGTESAEAPVGMFGHSVDRSAFPVREDLSKDVE